MTDRSVTIAAGLQTTYVVKGDGPTAVLLHGGRLGYSLDAWDDVVDALADDGVRAIAVDFPGYGGTEIPNDFSNSFTYRFLREFVEQVGTGRVHLIGHSNSGGNVVRLGIEHPELLASVIIVGTGSLMPVTLAQAAGMRRALAEEEGGAVPPTVAETREDFRPDVYDPAVLEKRLPALNAMAKTNFMAAQLRHRTNVPNRERDRTGTPLWQRLDELQMPVMAIFGDGDKNRAVERLSMLAERYPSIETHLLTECRHVVQWDQPKILVNLLTDFIRKAER